MTRLFYLFVAVCLACLCGTAVAETYVVNPEGTGDYATIEHALVNVQNGDVIELADGTYTGDGNRDVYWGGAEVTLRSQSGNPEACVIDCQGTELEPHRAIYFNYGVGSAATVEGITITNGWRGTDCGGAMKVFGNASPTITNCRFVDNHGDCVGAIFVQAGSPSFTDCDFEGNSTGDYSADCGALFVGGECSVQVTRCTFRGNSALDGGGAALVRFTGEADFVECLFIDNSASRGGALICEDDAVVTIENCTFVDNESPNGAQILCTGQADVTMTNSILTGGVGGDAVECEGTSLINVSCSDIWGNVGGDWAGCLAGQGSVDGNMSLDPCFCIEGYYIADASPCAPANNGCGVLIGARDEQCVDCGGDVPVVEVSWGQLKAGYR